MDVPDNHAFAWMRAVRDSDLESTTKHVLLTLGTCMDPDGGNCYPSIRTLCQMTSLSNRTVIDHLERADSKGWLERRSAGRSGQGWKRNRYLPAIPEGGEHTTPRLPEGGERDSPRRGEGGEPDDEKVVKQLHSTSSVTSTDTTHVGAHEDGDAVQRVFDHYVTRYADRYSEARANRLKLTACQRDQHLRARLREGYTVEELCKAIDGCFDDPWHQKRQKDELEYIVRNQGKVEGFLKKYSRNGGKGPSFHTEEL